MQWLCQTPKLTTIRINLNQTTPKDVEQQVLRQISMQKYLPIAPAIEYFPEIPEVLIIGNLSNQQTAAPASEHKQIIVDTTCAAALLRGAHIYAPGVLGMQSGTKLNEIVDVYADVAASCKRGTNTVYDSTEKVFIGRGFVRMQRYQIFLDNEIPTGIAIEMIETISGVPSIGDDYLQPGFAILQNLPSIICSKVLDPNEMEIILDMCAAPGNKTTHLAQLTNDEGRIVALDKSEKRVKMLMEKVSQFGFKSVQCYTFDSAKAVADQSSQCDNTCSPPYQPGTFDKILLDAPCSGFGNRPQLTNKMTEKMVSSYPIVQRKLLSTAIELLKIGGQLVYSTCTIFDAENERVISWALEKFGDKIELIAAEPFFGGPGWPNCGLSDQQRQLVQRFGPDVDPLRPPKHNIFNDTVGFFIAKIKKK